MRLSLAFLLVFAFSRPLFGADFDVVGDWVCVSETAGGKTGPSSYHETWKITTDKITINKTRTLGYVIDAKADPKRLRIFNKVGTKEVNLHCCILKIEDGKLIVCLEASDSNYPSKFQATKDDTAILLTFEKK